MNNKRQFELDEVYLNIASEIASMSFATRAKVGAILVKEGNIISMGWNGMPSGFLNSEIEIKTPEGLKTNPLVLHAESNAILKCARNDGASSQGSVLYVTMSPCTECCKLIIQAGIKKVFYKTVYRDVSSLKILEKAGIQTVHIPGEEYPPKIRLSWWERFIEKMIFYLKFK